jgi:serine O-acetyltransferase
MSKIALAAGSREALARYTAQQLNNMVPEQGLQADLDALMPLMDGTLERLRPILAAVRAFETDRFDHYNSLQYASWLYLLGNEQHRRGGAGPLAARLFCLNRALNALDLFYAVALPEVFFISHGLGAVLGNASYGERLVLFQNVTVGRVGEDRPRVGSNVVLYPGAMVTGKAVIGNNCVVAAGTVLHGVEQPDNTVALQRGGKLEFRALGKDYSGAYLHPAA